MIHDIYGQICYDFQKRFKAALPPKYILLTQLETFTYQFQNIKKYWEQSITSKITFYFDVNDLD